MLNEPHFWVFQNILLVEWGMGERDWQILMKQVFIFDVSGWQSQYYCVSIFENLF